MQQPLPKIGRQSEVGHFCFCFFFSWILFAALTAAPCRFRCRAYRLSPLVWLAHDFFGCGTLSRRQRCWL